LARKPLYEIRMQRRAKRDLQRLSDEDYERVNARVHSLAQNPRPDGVVKLKTDKASYRIRVGPWRVIYLVDDARQVVVIVRVLRRAKDTYRPS
jgi:mRNA interferase RelE/StbE